MAPPRSHPRFRFIGGKGGVGKTTCAAALAVKAARSGRRTLVISTDPAPSLGDALGQRLGPRPRAVRGVPRLHAVEVDASASLARWIAARRKTLETIALRGTWLDEDDVSRLLKLSLPGIDEIAGLLEIAELGGDPRFDRIVVDTAPTGHLLRMFGMPEVLGRIAQVFDHMQDKHRIMVEALAGRRSADAADDLIAALDRQAADLRDLLRDPARAAVSWVTLPEPMSVEETRDALRRLHEQSIVVDAIVVNRMTAAPPERCAWCTARMRFEAHAVGDLASLARARGIDVHGVPAERREPRGAPALARMGALLERREPVVVRRSGAPPRPIVAHLPAGATARPAPAVAPDSARLVMFGGKGGVGKTTCAAAVALEVARARPRKRVLLLSTDPAHSLADALGVRVSDAARRIPKGPPNLLVRELDAARIFDEVRGQVTSAIERLFDSGPAGSASSLDVAGHDREVMRDLLELAPPGVDELVAIMEVTESLTSAVESPCDLIVMDTAPTGHALRLLEMPSLVHDWVKALMAIVLKYQAAVGIGELGSTLLRVSQGLGRLRSLLGDPARARFVAVTRLGTLPRAETVRLLARLNAAGISAPTLIVNAAGAGTCTRCREERAGQANELAVLEAELKRGRTRPDLLIVQAEMPPPHGIERLRAWWGQAVGAGR